MQIDTLAINQHTDLLTLAQQFTQLRRVASTAGGEYAGPCPFCSEHGRDRFRVQPNRQPCGVWMCRYCTNGRWQDAISLGRRLWPGWKFAEVCQHLAGGGGGVQNRAGPVVRGSLGAYQPPEEAFQVDGKRAVEICQSNLWESAGKAARDYLTRRGLKERTMLSFTLGFSPGAQIGSLYLPRGIVLPCQVKGEVWYLKIALLPGEPVKCEGCGNQVPAREACRWCGKINKYRGVRGNRPAAIFNADWLGGAEYALFCEGEFDAMIAHQELNEVLPCVTLGSAGNRLDLAAWGSCLLPLMHILVAYDNDAAGKAGADALQKMTSRVRAMPLPGGVKDINAWYLAGGNLWQWIRPVLAEVDTIT